jgi:hypothetical protein
MVLLFGLKLQPFQVIENDDVSIILRFWSTAFMEMIDLRSEGGVCIDDNTVIEILLLIPETQNATQVLLEILEVREFKFCIELLIQLLTLTKS